MEKKHFEVKIFYSGYCTHEIEAENEGEAIIKARILPINNNEILSNLENWKEADTAEEIKNEKD
jgi:hypothetical protein